MDKAALVIVDAQRDFVDVASSPIATSEKAFCLPGATRVLGHAREQGWQVVHVGTEHENVSSLPLHLQRTGVELFCETGSSGAEFVIEAGPGELSLTKTRYSVFSTGIAESLDGVETVIWAGVATDCCVLQSVFDAHERGLRSILPVQALSASTRAAFVQSLLSVAKSAGDVVDLDELVEGEVRPLDLNVLATFAGSWYDDRLSELGD